MSTFEFKAGPVETEYAISAVEKSLVKPEVSQDGCTYPVKYELVETYNFMTIDEKTGVISIETHNRDAADIYEVEIRASSLIPVDFNNLESVTKESIYSFTLELYVPLELCALSSLDEIILVDMETSVLGEPQSQSFEEV